MPESTKKKIRLTRKYKIILGIVILLVIFRLILPYIILYYANKTLAEDVKGYYGHIDDIDLSIYRGAYTIKDFFLNKMDSVTNEQTEFIRSVSIDLSVEWSSLFHGMIAGELEFNYPRLIFTKDRTDLDKVKKDTTDFRKLLKEFMPLKVNRFEVNNGALHYIDNTSKPKVDISLQNTHILALNLKNAIDKENELPSTVTANASAYEGTLNYNMKLNALAARATFDMNAEIKNTNLILLNDFLKAYGKFDVNRGNFGLYTEIAAKDGKFRGYVKPVIKDLDVIGPEDRRDNIFTKIWESLVGGVGVIFRNQKEDQVATKVPIEGDFKNPDTDIIEAIWEVLKNAFIQALVPAVDNQININSVKNNPPDEKQSLFKKIFSSSESQKKKRKERKKEK